MFGYVREYAPELKVKEQTLYKAIYCGLCKSMGKCCGNCSRLTLSYDVAFLSVARLALENTKYSLEKKRCIVHPLRKRLVMKSNETLNFTARVSALLTYGKLKDNISDTKGIKKIMYKLILPIYSYSKKRAGLAQLYEKISSHLERLSECEGQRVASVDIPAQIFGDLTADILSYKLDGKQERIAKTIGFHTGKWIYAVDALDDMKDDIKNGSYNPFVLMYGDGLTKENAHMIKSAFVQVLAEIERATDLADIQDDDLKGIIYNIIYYGMKRKSDEIADNAIKENKIEQKSI